MRFALLSRLVENSFDSVRRTRQFAANFLANQTASVVGAMTFLGASALTVGPITATIALTAVTSIAARAIVKHLISGPGYGRVEMVQDSLFSAAAGIGRSSKQVMSAFRFTQSLTNGGETRLIGYVFSWVVNKIAALGESFGLNRKPKYLEHIDRGNAVDPFTYTFTISDHVARYWRQKGE
jgi:hypothetical protein